MTIFNRLFGGETRSATLYAELLAKRAEVLAKRLYHLAQQRAHETKAMLASASPRIAEQTSSAAGEERLDHILTVALVAATLATLAESGEEVALRESTRQVFEVASTDATGASENEPHLARLRELWDANGLKDCEALSNHLVAAGSPSHDLGKYRMAIGTWVLAQVLLDAERPQETERLAEAIGRIAIGFAAQRLATMR